MYAFILKLTIDIFSPVYYLIEIKNFIRYKVSKSHSPSTTKLHSNVSNNSFSGIEFREFFKEIYEVSKKSRDPVTTSYDK